MRHTILGVLFAVVTVAICGLAAWLNREKIADVLHGKDDSALYI